MIRITAVSETSSFSEDEEKAGKIHSAILAWGSKNIRKFPWRNTDDPYRVIVAEIMLHRTKAEQVERIYEDFLRKYRGIHDIYKTPLDELMGDISSLGLSWRGRLMHEMARYIVEECDSRIPSSKEGLLKLPGVGPYIASALMCFVYKKPEPVLDTNTVRVIGRLHGIRISDSSRRSKKFESIMRSYLKYGCPRDFSLSLIDLAALVCTSSESPHCEMCPVGEWCCRCREMEGGGIT